MVGFEEQVAGVEEEFILSHPDPVILELNRLQNLLADKDRELGAAHGEIKGLRTNDALKDKAIEELRIQMNKLDEKLRASESMIENKNLEIKKIENEKREALSAQFAAEAALRRVHANQKDDDFPSIESFIAPLEAEIKMYKKEIAALMEDMKAMERLTKSKEVALLEAESILKSALERALIVEEVQNQNYELRRQIEIVQEENRILEKTNRHKVVEVEKLSETIKELEETVLAGGAAANAVRDYKRQITELNEEKRTLERELARANVSANRVASIVANEWKDENDKVMPVKQWLEERRRMQAEMQRLKDKLVISERTAKAESQLKDKFKLRLTTLEEGLKQTSSVSRKQNKHGSSILGFLTSNAGVRKKSARSSGKENAEGKANADTNANNNRKDNININTAFAAADEDVHENGTCTNPGAEDDVVSGFLYDKLQKEVTNLRRACEVKDGGLNAKDQQIQVDTFFTWGTQIQK
ncbi:Microtubule-associated protein 70-5 [Linum grandiflorum]